MGPRAVVVCVFMHDEKILVKEFFDDEKEETFYRPVGGGIEFGEHSVDALKREIKEELKTDITLPEYLGTLENIFTWREKQAHQIVMVYNARFIEPGFYKKTVIDVDENG